MTLSRIAMVLLAMAILSADARAQQRPPGRAEVRIDATSAEVDRLALGAGAAIPMGTYVRLALLAGGGIARYDARSDGTQRTVSAARADVVARFQIDPFHQSRRGVYGGGGVSYLASKGSRGQAFVTLVAGMELRDRGHVAPAIEVALGGGLRIGVALRRSAQGWR
jgi:hypothetical protein